MTPCSLQHRYATGPRYKVGRSWGRFGFRECPFSIFKSLTGEVNRNSGNTWEVFIIWLGEQIRIFGFINQTYVFCDVLRTEMLETRKQQTLFIFAFWKQGFFYRQLGLGNRDASRFLNEVDATESLYSVVQNDMREPRHFLLLKQSDAHCCVRWCVSFWMWKQDFLCRRLGLSNRLASRFLNQVDATESLFLVLQNDTR